MFIFFVKNFLFNYLELLGVELSRILKSLGLVYNEIFEFEFEFEFGLR